MDILFFAAVALYVFWKLREQFGKVDEEESKRIKEKVSRKKEIVQVVQNQLAAIQKKVSEQNELQKKSDEKVIAEISLDSQEPFRKIISLCNISAESFLNGVEMSFEMTLKSFAAGDLNALKIILSDKVFAGFEAAIEQRKLSQLNVVTNVIEVKAKIISANILGNAATVVASLNSKQINYITNSEGQIVEGKKDDIRQFSDVWTFKKDLSLPAKNWVISAT